jgi:hypothetical protein
MLQLISVLFIITLIYFVQEKYPVLAGLIAVIPIKIICTSWFAYDRGVFRESLSGMLIGQFTVGFILLIIYLKGYG